MNKDKIEKMTGGTVYRSFNSVIDELIEIYSINGRVISFFMEGFENLFDTEIPKKFGDFDFPLNIEGKIREIPNLKLQYERI